MKPGIELCPVTSEELMNAYGVKTRRAQQKMQAIRKKVKKEKTAFVMPEDVAKFLDITLQQALAFLGRLNDDNDKDKDSDKK